MSYGQPTRGSLLAFSTRGERASLFRDTDQSTTNSSSMPAVRKRSRRKSKGRRRSHSRKRVKSAKGVRVTKGRLSIRVAGYSGLQKIPASQLVKFVPLTKLRAAAKKVLACSGKSKSRKKKKSKGRKKGRKKRLRR